jgi:hypothetical protein
LFDIENTGQEQGAWVGYGRWKAAPALVKPKDAAPPPVEDEDDDKPVLHRKKHAGDPPKAPNGASTGTSGSDSTSASSGPPPDSDRPVLKKKQTADDASASTQPSSQASSQAPTQAPASGQASSSGAADDPDRPKLKADKKEKKQTEDVGHVDSLPDVTDPDRPRLKRGKSEGSLLNIAPSLMGLPPDMQQAVAVSDAKDRPDHPWQFTWAHPEDEDKMKAALEDMARDALGLKAPPPPAPKKTATASQQKAARKSLKAADVPPPVPLTDEQFRVFELAYGSGATMVLTAHTDAPKSQMKFVTIVAQPDLYGNVLVLLKSVTDGAHLDETPRMRLVDAVDALADNRGELLFELRGDTQRQFALYRVLRGQAEKLFVSVGGEWGLASN